MFQRVLTGFWRKARLFMPFSTRWNDKPINNVESAAEFVSTRAAFVAQTTLYGYIRTRAGTRYTALFDDAAFAQSINIAKWRLFLACATDLAGYVAALCMGESDPENEPRLAVELLRRTLAEYDEPAGSVPDWAEAVEHAEAHLLFTKTDPMDWLKAFGSSEDALIHWAPIADELKIHDEEIVRNSIRFKWKDVRLTLATLLRAGEVADSFAGAVPPAAE